MSELKHIEVTLGQMNLILMAVEYGFKQCEKGNNLERALAGVYDLYRVEPSK